MENIPSICMSDHFYFLSFTALGWPSGTQSFRLFGRPCHLTILRISRTLIVDQSYKIIMGFKVEGDSHNVIPQQILLIAHRI